MNLLKNKGEKIPLSTILGIRKDVSFVSTFRTLWMPILIPVAFLMLPMDRDYTDNDIYRKLLSDKLGTDLGYVYENVIAQMLRSAGNELFYYTFKEQIEKNNGDNNFSY